jgi:hypothetical protein
MNVFDSPERGSYGKHGDVHLKEDEAKRQIDRHKQRGLVSLRTVPLFTSPPTTEALQARIAELEKDAARFQWFLGDAEKAYWLVDYLQGVSEHWTLDQWRISIDAAMKGKP